MSSNSKDLVFVYVATTEKHFQLFLLSIRYLRLIEKDTEVILFTDKNRFIPPEFSVNMIEIAQPSYTWYDKYLGIFHDEIKNKNIIYLDCDTVLIRPISRLAALGLSNFELLIRDGMGFNYPEESTLVFEGLSQFNTGVIIISFHVWETLRKHFVESLHDTTSILGFEPANDQVVFRVAAVKSGVRICNLSSSWNFMGSVEFVNSEIRVLHFAALHSRMNERLLPKLVENCTNAQIGDLLIGWKPIWDKKGKRFKFSSILLILLQQTLQNARSKVRQRIPYKGSLKMLLKGTSY